MYEVVYTRRAAAFLETLDRVKRRRIQRAVERLRADPRAARAKRLSGDTQIWRARAGDYRILYRIEDDRLIVLVLKIGHRKEVYRRLE